MSEKAKSWPYVRPDYVSGDKTVMTWHINHLTKLWHITAEHPYGSHKWYLSVEVLGGRGRYTERAGGDAFYTDAILENKALDVLRLMDKFMQ